MEIHAELVLRIRVLVNKIADISEEKIKFLLHCFEMDKTYNVYG